MGLFDKWEHFLESTFGGAGSRVFASEVDPTEIGVGLQKQLDTAAKALDKDRRLVPNEFTVVLSRHDYDRWVPYSSALNAEFIPGLRKYAATRHYVFTGPITIAYELDETARIGRFTIASNVKAGVMADPGVPGLITGDDQLVLQVNGVRHPLTPGTTFTIGRGTEADLRVNDPGVSRLHASLNVEEDGTGQLRVTITDLGSMNGLLVDGQKVRSAQLTPPARIQIGSTRMLVHSPVGE